MVGCNIRTEAPVLNARIRKCVEEDGLEVGLIGYPVEHNYAYAHLGTSTQTLKEIADGTHPVCEKLRTAKFPMIITSSNVLAREDGEAVLNNLKHIAENTNVVNQQEGWNGLNILHTEASKPGACDLGIPQYKGKDSMKNIKVVYLL